MLQIISANRLTDGRIVYRDTAGQWQTDLSGAAQFADKSAAETALAAAQADVSANLVVDVEPVELTEVGGKLTPVTMRNRIRLSGPSILEITGRNTGAAAPAHSEQNDVSI